MFLRIRHVQACFLLKYFQVGKFHVTRLISFNILGTPAKFNTVSIQNFLVLFLPHPALMGS